MIPKIIHRVVPRKTTELMDMCWKTVIEKTPDFEHITHYDDEEYSIVGKELLKCEKGAFKADLIRLEVIYKYGGVYLDSDIELYKSIEDLLYNDFIMCKEDDEYISNLVIGALPENKIILEMINMSLDIINSGKLVYPYLFSDPNYSDIYQAAFGPYVAHLSTKNKKNITLLESNTFDVFYHKEKTGGIYGKHYYANSWSKE
jgi:hypothetical protein